MNWFNSIFILITAYLAVYLEASVGFLQDWFGAQVDLLPPLVVYAALSEDLVCEVLTALLGGLWFDSLSANNLGVSVISLLAAGLTLQQFRGLLLRQDWTAQFFLGAAASLGCPLISLLVLLNLGNAPLLAWSSMWQLLFMAIGGGLATPIFFRLFPWLHRTFNYQPEPGAGCRPDRQIKRGRS